MGMKAPRGIARFDSAAAMARALGLCLHGCAVDSLSGSPLLDRVMPLVNLLPAGGREWVYAIGGMTEAIAPREAHRLDVGAIARWLVGHYPERRYPAAFIGSSNGALVHLAAALGVPWLAQTFLCPVRRLGSDPDDAEAGLAAGLPITRAMLDHCPDLAIHHMQDPNQDRLMLQTMSYFRLKFRRLPPAYRAFLTRCLPRGATLYVDICTQSWPVTRTSERSVFQFGAVGGAGSDDYFRGGQRVRAYFARYGVDRARWEPPEPTEQAPEAEWGFEPALLADLRQLAAEQGWRLVTLTFADPEDLSFAAAAVYRSWYHRLGIVASRLLVDNFVLMDPLRTLQLRAIPFWLIFNTEPSAQSLERFLDSQPGFDEIDAMLFSNGMEGIGLVPIAHWRRLIGRARRQGRFLGVDERRYPRDFATFIRFRHDLARLGPVHVPPPPLGLEEFETRLRGVAPAFGIDVAPPPATETQRVRRSG